MVWKSGLISIKNTKAEKISRVAPTSARHFEDEQCPAVGGPKPDFYLAENNQKIIFGRLFFY